MLRLNDLYKAMETLRREGLSLSEDLEKQVNELEENIVKKEILPIVTENIAPALKQVQRELVLVVDYVPGAPISVHLSRKRNFAAGITDAKEILPAPQVMHASNKGHKVQSKKSRRKGLVIEYPNGEILQMSKAGDTLTEFIRRVGYQKVRALGISIYRMNLVSNTIDKKHEANQHQVASGWFVNTHSNGETKVRQIQRISDALHLGIKVELIK